MTADLSVLDTLDLRQTSTAIPDGASERLADVQARMLELMAYHGLRPGKLGGWSFSWDRASVRAGRTSYEHREITLSPRLMAIWPWGKVEDTMLHEIAHALTPGQEHNYLWMRKAHAIGARPEATYDGDALPSVPRAPRPPRPPKYTGYCPDGHPHYRQRRPKAELLYWCRTCSPRFDERYLIAWEQ